MVSAPEKARFPAYLLQTYFFPPQALLETSTPSPSKGLYLLLEFQRHWEANEKESQARWGSDLAL
jgi:hypothetical protein